MKSLTRLAVLAAVVLSLGLTAAVWLRPAPAGASLGGSADDPPAADETAAPSVEAILPGNPPPGWRIERAELGRGGTLASALERLNLPSATGWDVVQAAGSHLDLRRLPAQTGIAVTRDVEQIARSVAIRPSAERFLRIHLPGNEAQPIELVEWIDLAVETRLETIGGRVRTSVAQAIGATRHGRMLTPAFADVFQWDVDLLVDPRPGDEVRIVYEVRELGETPDDLPSFGDAAMRTGEFIGLGPILAASYEGQIARANAFWIEDRQDGGNYYDDAGQPLRKSFLKSPLNYRRISSRFSRARRNPVTRRVVPHHGVDFAAASGTPVVATADGTVSSAGWDGALGRCVRVRHGSEYVTLYGHLSRFARGIRRGTQVKQNQVIGYVGSSGRATGPHLHYTVMHGGRAIDPLRMKNPPVEPLDPAFLPQLHQARSRWSPVLATMRPGAIDMAAADGASQPGSGVAWVGL